MSTGSAIDKKLAHFTEMLTSDAMADSQRILEEIQRISAESLVVVEDEALQYAYQHIKASVARIRTEAERRVSKQEMENKREVFALKLALSSKLIEEVTRRVLAFTQSPAYPSLLISMCRAAVKAFGGMPTELHLRPQDMHLAPELQKQLSGLPVTFVEGQIRLGGLQAFCPEKHREIDSSFDMKFEELQNSYFSQLPIA